MIIPKRAMIVVIIIPTRIIQNTWLFDNMIIFNTGIIINPNHEGLKEAWLFDNMIIQHDYYKS